MASKGQKVVHTRAGSDRTHSEKPIKLLIKREFQERFYIPNIYAYLVDGAPTSTKKESLNVIFFSKEQF